MAEEIAYENCRISNSEGLVTLTLSLVILHSVVHQSSTSTYRPNVIKITETFCGRMDVRSLRTNVCTDGRTDGRQTVTLRLPLDATSVIICSGCDKQLWVRLPDRPRY